MKFINSLNKTRATALAAAIAVLIQVKTAEADVTNSLYNLANTPGATLSIGDKIFSGFTYLNSGLSAFNASNILVTASIDDFGVYDLTWGGNISFVSGSSGSADLKLNYTVTANPGQIFMIDQNYTGSAQPAGGAFLSVDENVFVGSTNVANSHLQANDLSDPFAEPGDNLFINPPQSTVDVTKDIAFGIVNGGFVTISEVEQSFHQVAVPEPASVGLFLAGLGALVVSRRFIPKK